MFRITVFGGLRVTRSGTPIEGLAGRRGAFLAALAIAGRRGLSRDRLLLYFWPDSTEERARHSLAQTVYTIHKTLGREVVESAGQELRLVESLVTSDVGDLLAAEARGDAGAVAAAYAGPLLDGFILADAAEFDAWITAERARLEGIARDAIEAVAKREDETGDPVAVRTWRRLVELDPLTTRYAVGYARALARGGDAGTAVRHLRDHASRIKSELNLPTPAAVTALVAELTRLAPREPTAPAPRPAAGAIPPVSGADLGAERMGPVPTRSRWRTAGFVGLAAVVLVAAGLAWSARRPARAVSGGAMVVVTDVQNLTGDSTLGGPLDVALRVGLEQAGNFSVYPRGRLRTSLALMGRAGVDTVLDEAVAREIALREAGSAVVAVAIAEVGGRFDLTARVVDPQTRRSLASHRVDVTDRARLLAGADELTAWIRRQLGDPRWDTGDSLPLVTTSSLPALYALAGAGAAVERGDWVRARTLLEHALTLDTGFAMAQAALGQLDLDFNRVPEALAWLREAERRAARLTELEQLEVRALLANAEGRLEDAVGFTSARVARYPSGASWWFHGRALRAAGRDQEAVTAFGAALRLSPANVDAHHELALAHKALGNYRDALDAYAEVARLDSTVLLRAFVNHQWGDTYVSVGDLAGADSVFRKMLARPQPGDRARGHRSLAYLAIRRGRFADAVAELRASVRLQVPGTLSEYRDVTLLADVARSRGDDATADAALARAVEIVRRHRIQAAALMFAGRQLVRSRQLDLAQRLLDSLEAGVRLRPDSHQDQSAAAILAADLALARGRPAAAGARLARQDFETWNALGFLLRAETFERLGRMDSAVAMARAATQDRFVFGHEGQTAWLQSFATLARLAEAAGDSAAALQAWTDLLELWKEGDADLPPLMHARRELARLQVGTSR